MNLSLPYGHGVPAVALLAEVHSVYLKSFIEKLQELTKDVNFEDSE